MTIIPRGKGEDQTLLASIIYEAAGGRAGSLTYDGFVRAFRAASQTDLFHRVFGAANLTDERCFVRLYAMLQRKAVFQMKLKGNEQEIERFQRIGTALKGMKQPAVPSLISLVREFQGSEWDAELEVVQRAKGLCPCGGCLFVDQEENRRRLLLVIEAHNAMFAQRAACGTAQNSSGFVERIDAKEKDLLYVQADLHGDLATPLALHVWLIKKGAVGGYLPSSLRLVFLGDYLDRGSNDIELLTFLLVLHMKNPSSVFLLRGNHESFSMASAADSAEGGWILQHKNLFRTFYRSLPLAVCVGVQAEGVREVVHFSHGFFPPSMFLGPLFQKGASPFLSVPKQTFSLIVMEKSLPAKSLKSGYLWTDVDFVSGSGIRGIRISPLDARHYGLIAGEGAAVIEAFVRAHEHFFKEWTVPNENEPGKWGSRVFVTTLPVSTGCEKTLFPRPSAMLFEVGEKVRNWTKKIVFCESTDLSLQLFEPREPTAMWDRSLVTK